MSEKDNNGRIRDEARKGIENICYRELGRGLRIVFGAVRNIGSYGGRRTGQRGYVHTYVRCGKT